MISKPAASNNGGPTNITLDELVNVCLEKGASDIHFGEGVRLGLRIHGAIAFLENVSPLTHEQTEKILFSILPDAKEQERFKRMRELDFSYVHSNGVHFRVNAFYRSDKVAVVMRMIGKHTPTIDELGVPPRMKDILAAERGLILVTGAAGSGKSTSIQAMLEHINENFVRHLVTIENPIEYPFENKKSIFSQREVGKDTLSFLNGLQSAGREDANVVMVSDLKGMEALDAVLELVETGHLVIAAMSTLGARQTLSRLLSFFPQDQQEQVSERLADNLKAVLSQSLVSRADGHGLLGVFELLLTNNSIKNLIRRRELRQLHVAMSSAIDEGMFTMDTYAYRLAENGLISKETLAKFTEAED